jgi:hypothetical protein
MITLPRKIPECPKCIHRAHKRVEIKIFGNGVARNVVPPTLDRVKIRNNPSVLILCALVEHWITSLKFGWDRLGLRRRLRVHLGASSCSLSPRYGQTRRGVSEAAAGSPWIRLTQHNPCDAVTNVTIGPSIRTGTNADVLRRGDLRV